jgi:hypothetical protein
MIQFSFCLFLPISLLGYSSDHCLSLTQHPHHSGAQGHCKPSGAACLTWRTCLLAKDIALRTWTPPLIAQGPASASTRRPASAKSPDSPCPGRLPAEQEWVAYARASATVDQRARPHIHCEDVRAVGLPGSSGGVPANCPVPINSLIYEYRLRQKVTGMQMTRISFSRKSCSIS